MTIFFGVASLIFGLVIGSFLNVCIHRIPLGLSLSYPPSRCPACEVPIRPADNVPVVSFLLLGGACRACRSPISWRYPVVEMLTGAAFLALYFKYGLTNQTLAGAFLAAVLIVVSFMDIDTGLIPNRVILSAIALAVLPAVPGFFGYEILPLVGKGAFQPFVGLLAGGGSLLAIAIIAPIFFKKDAMGGGDIKLAAFIGLFLGGYVLIALFLGFLVGAIAGVALIASGRREKGGTIPFGPYLSFGAALALLFGPQLWHAYLSISGLLQ